LRRDVEFGQKLATRLDDSRVIGDHPLGKCLHISIVRLCFGKLRRIDVYLVSGCGHCDQVHEVFAKSVDKQPSATVDI